MTHATIFASLVAIFCISYTHAQESGKSYVRGCYYTNWAQYRDGIAKYTPDNYAVGTCTHIFYAFAMMNPNFQIIPFEWNDEDSDWSKGMYTKVANLKQKQPGLKVLLSMGGWTFSEQNAALLTSMASTGQNRASFTNSVVKFVRRINFDGFDVDWEYPKSQDKSNFALLMREMRAAFEKEAKESGKPRLLLTAAVSANQATISAGYDAQSIGRDLDLINIMSYDLHGAWDKQTGFNAPLFDRNGDQFAVKNAAEYWHKIGVPKSKLVIGFGTYGRGWTLASMANTGIGAPGSAASPAFQYTKEAGMAAYYEICDLIEKKGYKEYYDESQQAPYVVGEKDRVWIGYDNVRSFNAKLDWLMQNGFAGAFIWALDMDDFQGQCKSSRGQKYPLLNAINAKLTGAVTQPQGTDSPLEPITEPITESQTDAQTEPEPTQPPVTQDPNGPFQCLVDGIQANPASCETYYHCVNGNAFKMQCPAGLHFDDSAKLCNWPDAAKCTRG